MASTGDCTYKQAKNIKISPLSDIKHKTLPVIDHYVFLTKYYPVIPERRKPQKGISLCCTNIYVCVNKGQRTPF